MNEEIQRSILTAIEAIRENCNLPADSSDLAQIEAIHIRRLLSVANLANLAALPAPQPAWPDGVEALEERIRQARYAHAATGAVEDSPEIEQLVAEHERLVSTAPQPGGGGEGSIGPTAWILHSFEDGERHDLARIPQGDHEALRREVMLQIFGEPVDDHDDEVNKTTAQLIENGRVDFEGDPSLHLECAPAYSLTPTAPIALPVRAAIEILESALGVCFADSHAIRVEFLESEFPDSLAGKCIRNIREHSARGKSALAALRAALSRELEEAKAEVTLLREARDTAQHELFNAEAELAALNSPRSEGTVDAGLLDLLHRGEAECAPGTTARKALRAAINLVKSETEGRDKALREALSALRNSTPSDRTQHSKDQWCQCGHCRAIATVAAALAHEQEAAK